MGCCVSTNGAASGSHAKPKPNRVPPPTHPLLEEETVKEVLSETPTPKPSFRKIEQDPKKPTLKSSSLPRIGEEDLHKNNVQKKPTMAFKSGEISDVSEICSTVSESVSTLTTERRDDDDAEVRQRSPAKFRYRSFSGDLKREKTVGKSPGRNSEQSPGRVKTVPGKERPGLATSGLRGSFGNGSLRRSKSPATRTDGGGGRSGLGRSPSARKFGKSPGRVRSELAEKNRKVEEDNRENKWPPISNDSLENPLVSLECFIFL
ncbi:unnamed protein product [Ilex paraguariensis]|uniref:Uncharacterized protein n=1 Tax=Ilex paraguariensis TaxID=185542 RepID=A0ABC8TCR0_9AQUA